MDVKKHHLRLNLGNHGDGLFHCSGLAHDVDPRIEVGLQPGPENGVIVHDHHANLPRYLL
ncbi:hypothetical protein AHiyo8_50390 [Arthrobacter sp. Hiyo8]|nr:hypothetical protein AHiyo8_50390 [Arthrobacter sp. Hiyo8]